jgi:phenylacetate-CoA ligase
VAVSAGTPERVSQLSVLRTLYDDAPVAVQNVMISTYGLWLRHLRYGTGHRARVAALRRAERLAPAEWRANQIARLAAVTAAAAKDVPFYRERLRAGGVASPEALLDVPVLSKAEAQDAGRALVSNRYAGQTLQEIHTGGTTGRPLVVYCDREALQRNYAFFFRIREWAGIDMDDRVATFAGRTIVAPARSAPFWRHNWASRTLLCSSYHLAPDTLDAYLDALARFGPALIDAYPSSLEPLARRALERTDRRIHLKAIITSSETLFPEARSAMEAAFNCRVFDHYGSAEMVACVSQCEAGRYHIHPDFGMLEVLVDGRPALPGETGEIVATGFVNDVMPLIRYTTGDLAVLGEGGCPCGRTFPVIERIEGRQDDCIITPEGRRIGRLDPIFKAVQGIHEARIVQDAADHIRVEVVPRPVVSDAEHATLLDELRRRVGPTMRITIVPVERIARTGRGKLRTVVNLVSARSSAGPQP